MLHQVAGGRLILSQSRQYVDSRPAMIHSAACADFYCWDHVPRPKYAVLAIVCAQKNYRPGRSTGAGYREGMCKRAAEIAPVRAAKDFTKSEQRAVRAGVEPPAAESRRRPCRTAQRVRDRRRRRGPNEIQDRIGLLMRGSGSLGRPFRPCESPALNAPAAAPGCRFSCSVCVFETVKF